MAADDASPNRHVTEEDELFLMTNLYPRRTGLPVTVFASPRMGGHDVRIKVSSVPGNRMNIDGAAVVAVRPEPRLLHGELDRETFAKIAAWITLNRQALIDHWDGLSDGGDLAEQVQRLPD